MKGRLKVEHLSVSFFTDEGEVQAVRDVSFSLKAGEVLAVVGESGCGKSVLCKSIMKLLPENAKIKNGKILVNGEEIAGYGERRMRELRGKLGTATVFVTHDLGVVARIADRVAVMYAGKIVEIGTVDEIFYDPRHPYTWGLLRSIPAFSRGKESLPSIPGMPPSLLHPPKGDAFASRNAYALEIDFEEEPPMFRITDSHYAATWLLDERAPKVEPPIGGNTDGT